MSADLLRRAAVKLRGALAADYLTDGPWDCLDLGDRIVHIETASGAMEYVVDEPMSNASNAEYIALMHPLVALALAEWLENVASQFDVDDRVRIRCPAAVARAVLREPAPGK